LPVSIEDVAGAETLLILNINVPSADNPSVFVDGRYIPVVGIVPAPVTSTYADVKPAIVYVLLAFNAFAVCAVVAKLALTTFCAQLDVPKKPTALLTLDVKLLPLIFPITCNLATGFVVPIPTFPLALT
jgi:hypothetical protein